MRIDYSEDEDFPGQFGLWQANCQRSIASKAGQAALKRLEAALLALPEKALRRGKLVAHDGSVCAIGALARMEGKLPLPKPIDGEWEDDDEGDTAKFAEENLAFPHLVAWKVVEQNDIQNDYRYCIAEGPSQYRRYGYHGGGYSVWVPVTDEERYASVLKWVQEHITR